MKNIKYFIAAACVVLFAACQDKDWDAPADHVSPYGNNSITEDNIITIADLKADPTYRSAFLASKAKLVEKDIKIKGRVVGNDVGGNLYKKISIEDASGAIMVEVNQGGVSGYLPLGQEVIVNLKGLYVGSNNSQPSIGAPYNGTIGRMSKDLWNSHFKAIGGLTNVDPNAIPAEEFNTAFMNDKDKNAGKLVILKNVKFKEADGKMTFTGNETSGSVNTHVTVGSKDIIVRTSTYASFAKKILPTTEGNLTGIAQVYGSDWQIIIRQASDIDFK